MCEEISYFTVIVVEYIVHVRILRFLRLKSSKQQGMSALPSAAFIVFIWFTESCLHI
jgi:hypothetical protein